jgi:hypothetical protein
MPSGRPRKHSGGQRKSGSTAFNFEVGPDLFKRLTTLHNALNPNPEEGASLTQTVRQVLENGLNHSGMDDQGRVAIKARERLGYIVMMKWVRKRTAEFAIQLHAEATELMKADDLMIAQLSQLPPDYVLNPESAPESVPQPLYQHPNDPYGDPNHG